MICRFIRSKLSNIPFYKKKKKKRHVEVKMITNNDDEW